MESVDPDQITLVEALDDDFRKLAVDLVVGRPELLLPAAAAVDGTLLDVVPAELRELAGVVAAGMEGVGVVLGGVGGVDGGHVVQDGPQDALAEAVVPVLRRDGGNVNSNSNNDVSSR